MSIARNKAVACEACRRRKHRCDHNPSGCFQCRSMRIDCVYPEFFRGPGRLNMADPVAVKRRHDELQALQHEKFTYHDDEPIVQRRRLDLDVEFVEQQLETKKAELVKAQEAYQQQSALLADLQNQMEDLKKELTVYEDSLQVIRTTANNALLNGISNHTSDSAVSPMHFFPVDQAETPCSTPFLAQTPLHCLSACASLCFSLSEEDSVYEEQQQ